MASRLTVILGGCRSGKSSFAQARAELAGGPRLFIATCPAIDREMAERIGRHRKARAGRGWETLEETADLAGAIRGSGAYGVVLVDSLTMWVNNLMYEADRRGTALSEDEMAAEAVKAAGACGEVGGEVFVVADEAGLGIVPGNGEARRFRDLAGRANQVFAAAADEAYFLVAGLASKIKG